MLNKFVGKFRRFYAFDELLKQLIIRDVKLKYRRSYLGYLWSILNPLMLMMVLVVIFSNLFRFDIPNFPLYLISGQFLFSFMTEATNMSVSSITGNASLIKKTYVPKYIFTVSKVGSSLVNLLFSLGALLLVMVFTNAEFSWNLLFFPIIIFEVFIFSLGLGLWLSAITVFFRDVQYLWGVFISMWMYLTPLFYPVSIIPEEYQELYKNANPMYGYIEQFRDIVLHARFPQTDSILMNKETVIKVTNATVRFNKATEQYNGLKEYVIKMLKGELMFQEFLALKDVNLEVKKGESWGLIGTNGSGKSTLLKLICGILKPYKGTVEVHGNIAPLIELGAGFDGELTARENIYLNGALLGHKKAFMEQHFDEIIEFSELQDFVDVPLKNFSSGMAARLGFAVATIVKPEILIVDEVLAVGDAAFQEKCKLRMEKMLSDGTTLLFVSHSIDQVKELCQNVIWIDKGVVKAMGKAEDVIPLYSE